MLFVTGPDKPNAERHAERGIFDDGQVIVFAGRQFESDEGDRFVQMIVNGSDTQLVR